MPLLGCRAVPLAAIAAPPFALAAGFYLLLRPLIDPVWLGFFIVPLINGLLMSISHDGRGAAPEVHLLNVQPAVSGHVAMFFDDTELHELQQTAGEEVLAPVRAQLGRHSVPCSSSVIIVASSGPCVFIDKAPR